MFDLQASNHTFVTPDRWDLTAIFSNVADLLAETWCGVLHSSSTDGGANYFFTVDVHARWPIDIDDIKAKLNRYASECTRQNRPHGWLLIRWMDYNKQSHIAPCAHSCGSPVNSLAFLHFPSQTYKYWDPSDDDMVVDSMGATLNRWDIMTSDILKGWIG